MHGSNDDQKTMSSQPAKVLHDVKSWWMPSANPAIRHMLAGVAAAAIFHLCIGVMMLAFYLTGSDANAWKRGALVMLQMVAGLPWSLVVVSNSESVPLIEAGFVAGTLINGAIIGAILGYFAKAPKTNRDRSAA